MESSWGLGLGETRRGIGEDAASVAMEAPGLKGPWRSWLRLSILKRVPEMLLVKTQPSCSRRPQTLEMPMPWDNWPSRAAAAMEWSQHELSRQGVCAAEGGAGAVTQALWGSPEDREWSSDTGYWVLKSWSLVLLWFDCDCALVLPS